MLNLDEFETRDVESLLHAATRAGNFAKMTFYKNELNKREGKPTMFLEPCSKTTPHLPHSWVHAQNEGLNGYSRTIKHCPGVGEIVTEGEDE